MAAKHNRLAYEYSDLCCPSYVVSSPKSLQDAARRQSAGDQVKKLDRAKPLTGRAGSNLKLLSLTFKLPHNSLSTQLHFPEISANTDKMLSRSAARLPTTLARRGFHTTRPQFASPYHYPEGPRNNIPFNPLTRFFFLRYWGFMAVGFGTPFAIAVWQTKKNG